MSWFETPAELDQAVADIARLTPAARSFLSDLIEVTARTVNTTKPSKTAERLFDLGFLHIDDSKDYLGQHILKVSLWGEEAYETWERLTAARGATSLKPCRSNSPL